MYHQILMNNKMHNSIISFFVFYKLMAKWSYHAYIMSYIVSAADVNDIQSPIILRWPKCKVAHKHNQ